MDINKIDDVDQITSKEQFVEFLNILIEELEHNGENFKNTKLNDFLKAMVAWVEDMEGFFSNTGKKLPDDTQWRIFAHILSASKMYE